MRRFSALFIVLGLGVLGCHKRTPVTALPPPRPVTSAPAPAATPPNVPPPAPVPAPIVNPLEQADNAFNAGNYPEAARGYENYIQRQPAGDRRDQALFRLALTCAVPGNPSPDWTRMTALLKQLVDQFPQSPLKGPAQVILSIATDTQKRELKVKQLSTELEKLKQLDARRKRP